MSASWTPRQRWAARLNVETPPRRAWDILESLGPGGLDASDDADWARVSEAKLEDAAGWRRAALSFDVVDEELRAAELGARLIVRGDPDYPDLLASIHDPPLVLYVQGLLGSRPPVAFVGTRVPTPYGRRLARRLVRDVSCRGLTIVSGLARGIDAEAHLAALDARGPTWAVLGAGLGHVYPAENLPLARRIVAEGGAVISERPLGARPAPELFPRRNRIVAGLSWAVVVVEGRHKSGSLITARLAAECGREVLAVPGPADSVMSEAPHRLIADGARMAATAQDILAALPEGMLLESRDAAVPVPAAPPTEEEAKVMALLGADALSLDELVQLSGLDTMRISSIMFGLELKERVSSVPGQRYAQKEAR
ncbi:MAG: DNA-protecting protein DprA [Elusimicrobia bacterium]|nr:DNA-protecting protein DprA [Elusimicrobiota bacterium]